MRFEPIDTPLEGLRILQRKPLADERGFLCRLYSANELAGLGLDRPIAQINHTLTRLKGAVRGLHFQYPPHAETKLVSCLKGSVFDVAVDLRHGSPSLLGWHGAVLSADNHRSLLIPEGFAHGFQALEDDCELIYLHTAAYRAGAEGGLDARDPALAIDWPLPVSDLSERDSRHPPVEPGWGGIEL